MSISLRGQNTTPTDVDTLREQLHWQIPGRDLATDPPRVRQTWLMPRGTQDASGNVTVYVRFGDGSVTPSVTPP